MKKKVLVLLVVALMAAVPAMAASTRGAADDGSVGIGLNLGTNTGLGMKFGMGKFDIFADVGLSVIGGIGLGFDVGVSYEVYDADFGGGHHMPITVGVMVPMAFRWNNPFAWDIGALAQVGLEYQIPDVPVLFYLRVGLGVNFTIAPEFKPNVGGAGGIGVLYVF